MLSFFTSDKHRSKEETPKEYAAAPGTSIRFNPRLTDQLQHEHQELLNLYIQTNSALKNFDAEGVAQGLDTMRDLLNSHLLTEKVRLFVYLDHFFAGDEVNRLLVREFRRELDQIAHVVLAFFKKYRDIGSGKRSLAGFAKEFQAIGVALNKRIEKEERVLYPLYQEPQ